MGQITKQIKGKIIFKHETEADWKLSSYVPDEGEQVIYDPDAFHPSPRIKIGDGKKVVDALPFTTAEIPTKLSEFEDDVGYLKEESDPTVHAWAKAEIKPSYTAAEVGALPSNTKIPTKMSDLTNDSGFITAADAIPDYVIEEAESTISKIFSHGNLGRTIRFVAISDTHEDSAESYNPQITISNKHAGQAIKYIADRIGLDFVAHLGDASSCGAWLTSYEPNVLRNDIKNINKFVFSGVRGIKTAFIPGNHDMMSMNGFSLLNSGAFPLFGNMCSGNKDRLGGWGYFDIDDAKVRVIYLNTSDSPSSAAYLALSRSQRNWLCETLIDINTRDDADEWKVILLSHAPLDFGGANISTDILLPYVNGKTYGDYDFDGKNSAKIISNIHGHVHCFSYGYIYDRIRRFTVPNACFIGANHYASRTEYADWTDTTTYNKTANSGKDTAFSLVTIDLDSGMCYVDNHGAGIDRAFSTDYNSPPVNEISSAIASDGTPYNGGTGYLTGKRLRSSGAESDDANCVVTGFIPYKGGDVEVVMPNILNNSSHNYIHLYDSSFACIVRTADGTKIDGSYRQAHQWVNNYNATRTLGSTVQTIVIPESSIHSDTAYIRVSCDVVTAINDATFSVRFAETAILESISDITYTGSTTVGRTLDPMLFNFTANYSNGTRRTITGATSVNPATIEAVGNNTVTISYTEGTTTISGTITIVGTAVSVVNLFDKTDPDMLDGGRVNSSHEAVVFADHQL